MKVFLTGANGYVGGWIAKVLTSQGHKVIPLTRGSEDRARRFVLGKKNKGLDLSGGDALVHCAWDMKERSSARYWTNNVEASTLLFTRARAAGISRGVFISSFSAFPGCRSRYGQAKLAVEESAKAHGFDRVRPGLVWGGDETGGMTASLTKLTNLPVVPVIGGGKRCQYPVHGEDLAALVSWLLEHPEVRAKPISAASERGLTMRALLDVLNPASASKPHPPVPWPFVYLPLWLGELLRLPLPFRSDSLRGFVHQNPAPDFQLPTGCPVRFRPLEFSQIS